MDKFSWKNLALIATPVALGLLIKTLKSTSQSGNKPDLSKIQQERPLQVVITGGSRGIGFSLAKKFLELGDKVVICSRSQIDTEEAIQKLKQETNNENIYGQSCDITSLESVQAFGQFVKEKFGNQVDLWLNNAGKISNGPLSSQEFTAYKAVIDTNITGSINCYKVAYEIMQYGNGGHIFMMEGNGSRGNITPDHAVYGATKYGLVSLTKTLAYETQQSKVGVHRYYSGLVLTSLVGAKIDPNNVQLFNAIMSEAPDVAANLVPRLRKTKGTNTHIPYITTFGIVLRLLFGRFRGKRFYDEEGNLIQKHLLL